MRPTLTLIWPELYKVSFKHLKFASSTYFILVDFMNSFYLTKRAVPADLSRKPCCIWDMRCPVQQEKPFLLCFEWQDENRQFFSEWRLDLKYKVRFFFFCMLCFTVVSITVAYRYLLKFKETVVSCKFFHTLSSYWSICWLILWKQTRVCWIDDSIFNLAIWKYNMWI